MGPVQKNGDKRIKSFTADEDIIGVLNSFFSIGLHCYFNGELLAVKPRKKD